VYLLSVKHLSILNIRPVPSLINPSRWNSFTNFWCKKSWNSAYKYVHHKWTVSTVAIHFFCMLAASITMTNDMRSSSVECRTTKYRFSWITSVKYPYFIILKHIQHIDNILEKYLKCTVCKKMFLHCTPLGKLGDGSVCNMHTYWSRMAAD